jgi:hypothetical protein
MINKIVVVQPDSKLQENVNNGEDHDHKDFVMSNGGEIDFSVNARLETNEANTVSERGSVYQQLYPVFKELCSFLEPNIPEVQMHCAYLSKHILRVKERRLKRSQNAHLAGQFVSVSVNSNKRQKSPF